MAWPAAIAAIGGSVLDMMGQSAANAANWDIAQAQMRFQERMSNTAHQREVKDLIAAGLNPMLSARLGGASSPTGATARMESVTGGRLGDRLLNAATSAAQIDNIKAQTGLIFSQEKEADARRRSAEADAIIKENSPEFNSANYAARQKLFDEKLKQVSAEAASAVVDLKTKTFDLERMRPLLKDAQELINRGLELGMPLKESEAKLWEQLQGQGRSVEWLTKFFLALRQFNAR